MRQLLPILIIFPTCSEVSRLFRKPTKEKTKKLIVVSNVNWHSAQLSTATEPAAAFKSIKMNEMVIQDKKKFALLSKISILFQTIHFLIHWISNLSWVNNSPQIQETLLKMSRRCVSAFQCFSSFSYFLLDFVESDQINPSDSKVASQSFKMDMSKTMIR